MNIYNRIYVARIAPCSTTDREAIRNGAIVIHDGQTMTESFAEDAFLASDAPVPVVLSHDEGKVAGYLNQRIVHNGWHIGAFTLDHSKGASAVAIDRIKRGTPISIGARSLRWDKSLAELGVLRHTLARLDDISILAADEQPMIRGAAIINIIEPRSAPAVRRSADPAGVIWGGAVIRRPAGGVVLGVR